MANSLTTNILVDGSKNAVINVSGYLDSSNLAYQSLILPNNLFGIDSSGAAKAAALAIRKIQYNVQDVNIVILSWDGTTPVYVDTYTGRGKYEAENYGLFVPPASLTTSNGLNGGIGISTLGWTTGAILTFSLTLELAKLGAF